MISLLGEDTASISPDAEMTEQEVSPETEMKLEEPEGEEVWKPEAELESEPRAGRPNFLTATRFADFDLPPEIMEGVDKAGFEYCTPIQAQAIPVAMSGQDIAGQAQTGTGKTTAFLIPLLTRLVTNKPLEPGVPRAIIVTPTRELALQIHEDAKILAGSTSLRQVLVIGGMEYKEQADMLATGPEIVICTPGRIIDYLQQGVFKTSGIEVAVVDEADRLLDMGFIKDLKYLLSKLPSFTARQTMLFSATLDDRVLELTYQYMNPPQYITAEPDKSTQVNIEQELYHVGRDEKFSLLLGLLHREDHRRVIIFSNTKSGVEWLAKKLTMNGFQAEGITGDLPQPKRLKLMEAFKENRLQILVATDVASRGIHVDDVSHVYNYDLPQDAENYVHRIGRTARAGHDGKAVSFGCEDYVFHLEAIENLLGEKIPVCWAEQELFQDDQGGEVRLKDKRGGERKRGAQPSGGRAASGGRTHRGPAKSQRPGGIFGLAPRLASDAVDERQILSWMPDGEEILPVLEADVIVEDTAEKETADQTQARDGGRKRKKKRGRSKGGQQQADVSMTAVNAGQAEENRSQSEQTAESQAEPASVAKEPDRYPKKSKFMRDKEEAAGGLPDQASGDAAVKEAVSAGTEISPSQKSDKAEAVKAQAAEKKAPSKAAAAKKTTAKKADKDAGRQIEATSEKTPVKKTAAKKAGGPAATSVEKTPAKKAAGKEAGKEESVKAKAPAKKAAKGEAAKSESFAKKASAPKSPAKKAEKEEPVKAAPAAKKASAPKAPAKKTEKGEPVKAAPAAKKVPAPKASAKKAEKMEKNEAVKSEPAVKKMPAKKVEAKKSSVKERKEGAAAAKPTPTGKTGAKKTGKTADGAGAEPAKKKTSRKSSAESAEKAKGSVKKP